jgi:putative transposase
MQTKTLKLRVKDKHTKYLLDQARQVNMIWNHLIAITMKAFRPFAGKTKFLSRNDYHELTTGLSKEDGITLHSQTIQAIGEEIALRTKKTKTKKWKIPRFRKSGGAHKSLEWIPFKASAIKYKNGQVWYQGIPLSLWDSYGLSKYELGFGSFTCDARGRWYLNTTVKVPVAQTPVGTGSIGIDLGCKTVVSCSDGTKLKGRWYRKQEKQLKVAQRANNKTRTRAISAKIKNKRKDDLHKLSTNLVKTNALVVVGNVSSTGLSKTNMSKSVYDAGWGMFKQMLEYKCRIAGSMFEVVDERYTTQTCSECGSIPDSSPKGLAGLGIREWTCDLCGAEHDRDVNAAKNILAAGHCRLAVGIPSL